jgi:molybdopterin/thiamine biosynthesis adenylyltransferase
MWDRLEGVVNVSVTSRARVAIIGCGLVGSQVASRLSRVAVRDFLLVDGDEFAIENVPRSVLAPRYVGVNKARALAHHLAREMPDVQATAIPRFIRQATPARELAELLRDVTLAVVAVDQMRPQVRINRAALATGVPTLVPGLYGDNGGEVFVGLGLGSACFECWAGFRSTDASLRAVPAIGTTSMAVEQATVHLALGILDPTSQFRDVLRGARGSQAPRQLYLVENFGAARDAVLREGRTQIAVPVRRRRGCPGCAAGLALQRQLRRPALRRPRYLLVESATVLRSAQNTNRPQPLSQPEHPTAVARPQAGGTTYTGVVWTALLLALIVLLLTLVYLGWIYDGAASNAPSAPRNIAVVAGAQGSLGPAILARSVLTRSRA